MKIRSILALIVMLLLAASISGCASSPTATDDKLAAADTATKASAAPELARFRQLQDEGVLAARKGDFQEALVLFREAENLNPDDAELLGQIGTTLRYLKQYEEALSYFERKVDLNPNDYQALINIGVLQRNLSNFPEAIAAFTKVLALKPDQKLAMVNLADIHFQTKEYDSCRTYVLRFKKVVEAENPEDLPRWERNWNMKAWAQLAKYLAAIEKQQAEGGEAAQPQQ